MNSCISLWHVIWSLIQLYLWIWTPFGHSEPLIPLTRNLIPYPIVYIDLNPTWMLWTLYLALMCNLNSLLLWLCVLIPFFHLHWYVELNPLCHSFMLFFSIFLNLCHFLLLPHISFLGIEFSIYKPHFFLLVVYIKLSIYLSICLSVYLSIYQVVYIYLLHLFSKSQSFLNCFIYRFKLQYIFFFIFLSKQWLFLPCPHQNN